MVEKTGVLSCLYPRAFWLNWFNSTITVGEGARVGDRELLRYSNTSLYPISVIAMSTGWEADGDWEFSHMEGRRGLCDKFASWQFAYIKIT